MIADDVLRAVRRDNPVDELARQSVALRRKGRRWVGPCPICSRDPNRRDAARFECDATSWVCAVCADGGDVFRLVARLDGLDPVRDFRMIVDRLARNVTAMPTPEAAKRQGRMAFGMGADRAPPAELSAPDLSAAYRAGFDAAREQARREAHYRERERVRLHEMWARAQPIAGTPVEAYLARRGLVALPGAHLRYAADHVLFGDGREVDPAVLHRGPAMLAAITGPDEKFSGLHATWIDLDRPKGKVEVVDPATSELVPAKKVRGHKVGGRIFLGGCREAPRGLVMGEGIETVTAVGNALAAARRDILRTAFWSAIDLGNLGGRSLATVAHPTLVQRIGAGERPRKVPGPDPDPTGIAIPIPDSVVRLLLLGDSDSDPFTTRMAMQRACARYARPGRVIRVSWPPAGADFDDIWRAGRTDVASEVAA